jgi:hypothetical protein
MFLHFIVTTVLGDWICKACSMEIFCFDVGIEGYEFAPDGSAIDIDASSGEESNPAKSMDTPDKPVKRKIQKKSTNRSIHLDDSDAQFDDDEGELELSDEDTPVGYKSRKAPKKQIIALDDSDEE